MDPSAPRTLTGIASEEEISLWRRRGCHVCHGPEGEGGPLGPPLVEAVRLYLDAGDSRAVARARLIAYLKDPEVVKPLRKGGKKYGTVMPGLNAGRGDPNEGDVLADLLLRLAE